MLAETAELVARLSLDDKQFTSKMNRAGGTMSKLASKAGRVGSAVAKGLAAGAAIGAGIIAVNVKSGIESLATLESAVTSVDGAIKRMGMTGKVTGAQIATWANEIESSVQAAFDDKDITAATSTLIRFGKVTQANLRPAMVVMTDLAAKTGSVESAATLLAKALADPAKAAGRLTRAGVILTKAEQKRITALMKAGKVEKAQAIVLKAVERSTKGAAAAMNGPYQDAMKSLGDATEDAQRALAVGFLPVIQRAAKWLKDELANPATLARIQDFGNGLADAFDEAITFAQKIPWGAVADGLKTAATWAGKLFDAFRSLPPEMQATIIALAGLNKLSGGAISSIVADLGKGLIKGVLGMTAGVVNLKAAVVNTTGGPGLPGGRPGGAPVPVGGAPAAAAGGASALTVALSAASVAAIGTAVGAVMFYGIPKLVTSIYGTGGGNEAGAMQGKLGPSNGLTTPIFEKWMGAQLGSLNTIKGNTAQETSDSRAHAQRVAAVIERTAGDTRAEQLATTRAVAQVKDKQAEALVAFRAGERATQAGNRLTSAGNAKLAVIAAKKTKFTANQSVTVSQSVSVADIDRKNAYRNRVTRRGTLVVQ